MPREAPVMIATFCSEVIVVPVLVGRYPTGVMNQSHPPRLCGGCCGFFISCGRSRERGGQSIRRLSTNAKSGQNTAAVLTGRQTGNLPECAAEIGLRGKIECERDIDQRLIATCQQRLAMFEPLAAPIAMGRLTDGGLECPGEMEAAQACDRRQVIERKVGFEVSLDLVQHAGQPAPIKPFLCDEAGPGN